MTESFIQRRDRSPIAWVVPFLIPLTTGLIGTLSGASTAAVALCLPQIAIGAWVWGWGAALALSLLSYAGWFVPALAGRVPVAFVDHDSAIICAAVSAAFGMTVARLRQSFEDAYVIAGTDPLTGLLNRNSFYERIRTESNRGGRNGVSVTVAFIDCDNFKKFNDTRGHVAGDELLLTVAQILKGAVRSYDAVCRMGGDEFALLFPALPSEAADSTIARVHSRLKAMAYTRNWDVSFSIGAVVFPHPGHPAVMLDLADAEMYAVKQAGKDHYRVLILSEGEVIPAVERKTDEIRMITNRNGATTAPPAAAKGSAARLPKGSAADTPRAGDIAAS